MDYRGKYYTGKIWIIEGSTTQDYREEVQNMDYRGKYYTGKIWIIEGSTTQAKYGL